MAVKIRPVTLEDAASYRQCWDTVARERRHIWWYEAPPLPRLRANLRKSLRQKTPFLVAVDGALEFDFEDTLGRPVQLMLGAVYAAGSLPLLARDAVFKALNTALIWGQQVDGKFISFVMGGRAADLADLLGASA